MNLARAFARLIVLPVLAMPALATDLSDALMRSGLDPDALAAAGVTAGEVPGIAADVAAYLQEHPTALSGADASYVTAKQQVDELRRIVQAGTATEQQVTALATAKTSLASAEAARTAALDAIFAAGKADLAAGKQSALATIRANRAWAIPIEFLAKDHSQEQWVALRDALANEKISAEEGEDPDQACAALLLAERQDSAVAAAKVAHDANLATVTAAWNNAVD